MITNSDNKINPMFAIPFGFMHINDVSGLAEMVKKESYHRSSQDDGYISDNQNLLHDEKYKGTLDYLNIELNNYLGEIGVNIDDFNFYITGSWATKHEKGDYAPQHDHRNSLISGCLYLETDEDSGTLNFVNRQDNIFPRGLDIPMSHWNPINAREVSFTPKPGDLYFFPSQLGHYVTKSESDNTRYMIAFNSYIEGNFTNSTSSLKLEKADIYK